jgi:hypothetical protein
MWVSLGAFIMRLASGIASIVLLAAAVAQGAPVTKPTDSAPVDKPQVSSPYWSGASRGAPEAQLVADTVQAVPTAHAAAVDARWRFFHADNELQRVTGNFTRTFEQSAALRDAQRAMDEAWDAYDAARAVALEPVRSSDSYRAAASAHERLTQQIVDEHGQKSPDQTKIRSLAESKLQFIASSRLREMNVLADSDEVRSARRNYVEAANRVRSLRQQFENEIRESIDLADLRRAKQEALVRRLATQAYFASSIRAREIALDYAYYSRNRDRYTPGNAYDSDYSYSNYRVGYPVGYPTIRYR